MRRLSSAFLRSPAWSCRSDAAAAEVLQASSARARLSQSLLDIPAHARAAKNCLALCCWELSQGADCNTERWAPYRAWAAQLDHNNDAVITFNYDTACEQVLQHVGEQVPSYALRVRGAFRVRAKSLWTAPNEGFLELCACWSAPTSARRRTTSVRHPAGLDDLTPPRIRPLRGYSSAPESLFKCARNRRSSAAGTGAQVRPEYAALEPGASVSSVVRLATRDSAAVGPEAVASVQTATCGTTGHQFRQATLGNMPRLRLVSRRDRCGVGETNHSPTVVRITEKSGRDCPIRP
jgi:hypothetical protein